MMRTTAHGFELLDHPADLGFAAWAPTLPDLFAECALALTSILVDLKEVEPRDFVGVEVLGDDIESLLYNWLAEILYQFDGEGRLFCQCNIISHVSRDGTDRLQAELRGEAYDKSRHELKTYVKAVTFHQLSVKHEAQGYTARVYLDI